MPALSLINSAEFGVVNNGLEQKRETQMQSSDVQIKGNPTGVNCCQAMRSKRVTDPLNEVVRARLCGNHEEMQKMSNGYHSRRSSGSEHEADSFLSFSDMVCGFMDDEEDLECSRCNCLNGSGDSFSETESEEPNSAQILESLVCCTDAVELRLVDYVTQAVEMSKENERIMDDENDNERASCISRAVMNELKKMGYNAGICKSRPEHIPEFPAGDYEYIDVIIERRNVKKEERILVDIDFRVQFQMARPTKEYSALLQLLPDIFVGKAERLHKITSIMCEGGKRSLKKESMHIPPWRNYRYMQSKWLASYRRTTNPVCTSHMKNRNITINISNYDFPHREWQWQWQPLLVSSKPRKNGKVSALASALSTQAALTSTKF